MALTLEQEVLAREARRQELKAKIKLMEGEQSAAQRFNQMAQQMFYDNQSKLQASREELSTLEVQSPSVVEKDFGSYSDLEKEMRRERFAGKEAAIDFIQANPECLESDTIPAYTQAALATRPPDAPWLLQDAASLIKQYAWDAKRLGYIPDSSWESFRAFIVATPKTSLMDL